MKKIFISSVIAFLFSTLFVQAQKITFRLVNAVSLQPVEGAVLKSYLGTNSIVMSDKYGHITIQLRENDTLTISKEYYHPLYLFVKAKNFDTTHVISINMLPSKDIHETAKSNFTNLTDFDYHFVHDKIGDESHLKIKGFEHKTAAEVRYDLMHSTKNPGGIHVTPARNHKHTGENLYKLK